MRTITKTLYTVDELSEKALEKAQADYLADDAFFWEMERELFTGKGSCAPVIVRKGVQFFFDELYFDDAGIISSGSIFSVKVKKADIFKHVLKPCLENSNGGEFTLSKIRNALQSVQKAYLCGFYMGCHYQKQFPNIENYISEDFRIFDNLEHNYNKYSEEVFDEAVYIVRDWFNACQEYFFDTERFKEEAKANDFEFYEDGERF